MKLSTVKRLRHVVCSYALDALSAGVLLLHLLLLLLLGLLGPSPDRVIHFIVYAFCSAIVALLFGMCILRNLYGTERQCDGNNEEYNNNKKEERSKAQL